MRIVCPSCQAAYEVPEKLLSGAARKVRCARCGGAWTPEPEAKPAPAVRVVPPPAVVPLVADRLVPEPAEPSPGRGPAVMAAVAWAVSVALLVFAGWAAVAWRADIIAAWAPSRRLFALIGLD